VRPGALADDPALFVRLCSRGAGGYRSPIDSLVFVNSTTVGACKWTMSGHNHNDHAHCGDESHDHDHDHDHDHSSQASGPQDNLFIRIDRNNVVALNASAEGSIVIKPWHECMDETKVCVLLHVCLRWTLS